MCANFAFALPRPSEPRIIVRTTTSPVPTSTISTRIALWKPISVSSMPPRKKPTPLSAFLEPVRIATQRKSVSEAPSGTTSLTALFELIFVRSFAIPESAWATITYGTTSQAAGANASIESATSWVESPPISVVLSPKRAARKPPTRFVTIPKIS